MKKINLNNQVSISEIALGMLYLNKFEDGKKLSEFLSSALEMGITTFDHADNYGGGSCEELFGHWLSQQKLVKREEIQLLSKCGNIHPENNRSLDYPITYRTDYDYIMSSAERSLGRLQTDYLDILLLHRCDRLTDFEQVAKAFETLQAQGKVRSFGVSNFTPDQVSLLKNCYPEIVINQLSYSAYDLINFENNSDIYSMQNGVHLMAYSPLANGKIFVEQSEKAQRIRTALEEIRKEQGAPTVAHMAYAFLYRSPAGIIPVVGSTRPERVKCAIEALDYTLTSNQWYYIYTAVLGHRML